MLAADEIGSNEPVGVTSMFDADDVIVPSFRVGAQRVAATVSLIGAPEDAVLDAWIDFNGDGSFGGQRERITAAQTVVEGVNTIYFDAPVETASGIADARFRVRSKTDGSVYGAVDRFSVEVVAPIEQSVLFTDFSQARLLMSGQDNARIVEHIDLDRDGDLDFVTLRYNQVEWQESTPAGYVTHILLDSSTTDTFKSVGVADIDEDGDFDLVTAGGRTLPLAVHLNDGLQNFQTLTIEPRSVSILPPSVDSVLIGDVDADGDFDLVVSGDTFFGEASWYEQTEGAWPRRRFDDGLGLKPKALTDIDGDGDLDVIASNWTATNQGEFVLLRNENGLFSMESISDPGNRPSNVVAGDVDADGDIDLLVGWGQSAALLENLGASGFEPRELRAPIGNVAYGLALALVDLTGDGLLEAVVNTTVLRIADGTTLGAAAGELFVDVDQDGDLDAIVADGSLGRIFWNQHVADEVWIDPRVWYDDPLESSNQSLDYTFTRRYWDDLTPAGAVLPLRIEFVLTGQARLGEDFALTGVEMVDSHQGYFTIPAGSRSHTVRFLPLDDHTLEFDESLKMTIVENGEYAVRGVYERATNTYRRHIEFTLIDDDPGDFGDAPSTYRVDRAANGARHGATGPRLGVSRDAELNGTASIDALGDGLDDDGVVISMLHAGQLATATVTVNGVEGATFVDAWIDFDRDGTWGGAQEQVLVSAQVVNGLNHLTFAVPATATSGVSFARVRLSTSGGLSPYGAALDGEVEDVAVTLLPPPRATSVFLPPREIPGVDIQYLRGVRVVDFDRDGDPDLLTWGADLAWWANDGQGRFTAHVLPIVDEGADPSFVFPSSIEAVDFDRDGDIDLVTTARSGYRDTIYYLENIDGALIRHKVASASAPMKSLQDFDFDGSIDVVTTEGWYSRGQDGEFEKHDFSINLATGKSVFDTAVADIDGDGDNDVITLVSGNSAQNGIVRWYENDGASRFVLNSSVFYSGGYSGGHRVTVADMDGDGAPDILVQAGSYRSTLRIWVGPEKTLQSIPLETVRDSGLMSVADLDADGDLDLLSTLVDDDSLGWRRNDGSFSFTSLGVSRAAGDLHGVMPVDLDLDGDIDIVAWGPAPLSGSGLRVYRQVSNSVTAEVSHSSAIEGRLTAVTFTVRRDGPLDRPIEVPFSLGGAAQLWIDYVLLDPALAASSTGVLSLPAGQSEVSFRVLPIPDGLVESNEPLTLTLGEGGDYRIGAQGAATVVVVDDDWADFGDAPIPYATLLQDNAARHRFGGPVLGTTRQLESDGQPSIDAGASADDDGLAAYAVRVGAAASYLIVDVSAAPLGARVDAWIDFNGDGVWAGPEEKVANSLHVTNGQNSIQFATPPTARNGPTYARIRISSHGGLGSTGAAGDGEVEDYRIDIEAPNSTGGAFGMGQTTDFFSYADLFPYDLDGDGDIDFVEPQPWTGALAWIENRGPSGLHEHPPFEVLDAVVYGLAAGDITGDGLPELVVRSAYELAVLRFTGAGFETLWQGPQPRAGSGTIDNWMRIADIDADGRNDLLLRTFVDNSYGLDVYRYSSQGGFVSERIAEGYFGAPVVADIDQDGRLDIVASYRNYDARLTPNGNSGLAWFRGQPNGGFAFSQFVASSGADPVATDFDNDGDIDLLYRTAAPASNVADRIVWLENVGGGVFEPRSLFASGKPEYGFQVADLDGDGLQEVLVDNGSEGKPVWIANPLAEPLAYSITIENATGLRSPVVFDFDADGDLDLVATRIDANGLLWTPNVAALPGDYDLNGVVDNEDYYDWYFRIRFPLYRDDLRADGNSDGAIDIADYTVWRDHLGVVAIVSDLSHGAPAERTLPKSAASPAHMSGIAPSLDYLAFFITAKGERELAIAPRFMAPSYENSGIPTVHRVAIDVDFRPTRQSHEQLFGDFQIRSIAEQHELKTVDAAFEEFGVRSLSVFKDRPDLAWFRPR